MRRFSLVTILGAAALAWQCGFGESAAPVDWSPGWREFPVKSSSDVKLDGPEAMSLPRNWAVTGTGGMVASANPLATRAGLEALQNGGNAMDALLAVQWVLNVVEPQASGLGGGAFLLYYEKSTNRIYALDGREEAPALSDPRMFLQKDGTPIPFYPDRVTGGLAVGVPGTLALLAYAKKRFGKQGFSFEQSFGSAIRLARQGFRVSPRLSRSIRMNQKRISRIPQTAAIFMKNGREYYPGEVLIQSDLADTLSLIAKEGPRVFYSGKIAEDIIDTIRRNPVRPGRMTLEDLRSYRAVERPLLSGRFRGYTIYTMGPPSSAVALLESLALLERFSNEKLDPDRASGMHLKLEADRLAFADRALYLGDADFVDLNVRALLKQAYIARRSRLIREDRALPTLPDAGHPQGVHRVDELLSASALGGVRTRYRSERPDEPEGRSTSHIVIVDQEGNVVSCTTTIEMGFGSGLVVKNRGFLLNNELTDFDPRPGAANSVEGGRKVRRTALNAEARETKGGKRPRSSMSPVVVFRDGRPVFALGSPGGSRIIGVVGNVLLRLILKHEDIQTAINAPRFLHRHSKRAELEYFYFQESRLKSRLEAFGHNIKPLSQWNSVYGGVQGIELLPKGILRGGADLRREGAALPLARRIKL